MMANTSKTNTTHATNYGSLDQDTGTHLDPNNETNNDDDVHGGCGCGGGGSYHDYHDTNMSLCCSSLNDDDDDDDDDNEDDDDEHEDEQVLQMKLLSKVSTFTVKYDRDKNYRATELQLFNFSRPHMRTFHGSWICFLLSWFVWFSMIPLLPHIIAIEGQGRDESSNIPTTAKISMDDIWISNMYSMVGTVFLRILLGPLCDSVGAKNLLTGLLITCSIPLLLAGVIIHNSFSLIVIRFCIGCVGGTLVPAQYWITSHFVREICGMNMAIVAGWGAMGGGLAQIIMGTIIYPFLLNDVFDGNANLAWRVAVIFPAIVAIGVAVFFNYYSDDCPLGSYSQVQRAGLMQERSAMDSFRSGVFNLNAWILFVQ